jgi:hypothetical protein
VQDAGLDRLHLRPGQLGRREPLACRGRQLGGAGGDLLRDPGPVQLEEADGPVRGEADQHVRGPHRQALNLPGQAGEPLACLHLLDLDDPAVLDAGGLGLLGDGGPSGDLVCRQAQQRVAEDKLGQHPQLTEGGQSPNQHVAGEPPRQERVGVEAVLAHLQPGEQVASCEEQLAGNHDHDRSHVGEHVRDLTQRPSLCDAGRGAGAGSFLHPVPLPGLGSLPVGQLGVHQGGVFGAQDGVV